MDSKVLWDLVFDASGHQTLCSIMWYVPLLPNNQILFLGKHLCMTTNFTLELMTNEEGGGGEVVKTNS